jgi:hypothetical protein
MKKFLDKNFTIIVLVFLLLVFIKGCSDSTTIRDLEKEVIELKDGSYTKEEMKLWLELEGLKSEKRMIQSTDRKLFDLERQNQIDGEIKELEEKIESYEGLVKE